MTRTILVIEDDSGILDDTLELLGYENYHAIGAKSGIEGLQRAREYMPDLIISDIMMPEMDGYQLLYELRNDSTTATIPLIFLTARTDHQSVRQGMILGADDYLTKPVSGKEMLAAIRAQLDKHHSFEFQRLRQYTNQLVEKIENERQQIANLLRHDVIQELTGLRITLEISKQLPAQSQQTLIVDAQKRVETLLNEIDQLSLDLYPNMLEHIGLLPGLLWQINRFSQQTTIQIDFQHSGLEQAIPHTLKLACYRILQEALNNIARHAETPSAQVHIWKDEYLCIAISDKGKGFEVNVVVESGLAIGLTAIQERVMALGGDINILSRPNEGTEITVRLPLEDVRKSSQVPLLVANKADTLSKDMRTTSHTGAVVPTEVKPKSGIYSTRILLGHGNELVRYALRTILNTMPEVDIIAETNVGSDIIPLVQEYRPTIVLMDMLLPGVSGLELTRQIAKSMPQIRVIIISSYVEDMYILETLRTGAVGYVLATASTDEITKAVQSVASGKYYLSAPLPPRILERYFGQLESTDEPSDSYALLTNREREILQLVVNGKTSLEIAERLVISSRTAETHRANMMRKLGVRNQAELIRYALERGLAPNDL